MKRKILSILFCLFFLSFSRLFAGFGKYWGVIYDTTTGKAEMRLAGEIKVGESTTTIKITLDGNTGHITCSSITTTAVSESTVTYALNADKLDNRNYDAFVSTWATGSEMDGSLTTPQIFASSLTAKSGEPFISISTNARVYGAGTGTYLQLYSPGNSSSPQLRFNNNQDQDISTIHSYYEQMFLKSTTFYFFIENVPKLDLTRVGLNVVDNLSVGENISCKVLTGTATYSRDANKWDGIDSTATFIAATGDIMSGILTMQADITMGFNELISADLNNCRLASGLNIRNNSLENTGYIDFGNSARQITDGAYKLIISSHAEIQGDLVVIGTVTAQGFIEASDVYLGNALEEILKIKPNAGEKGDWRKVDHSTLPPGVRVVSLQRKKWYQNKRTLKRITPKEFKERELNPDDFEITEITEKVMGRNLGNSVQLNLRAIRQLLDKITELETKVEELRDEAKGKGWTITGRGGFMSPWLMAGIALMGGIGVVVKKYLAKKKEGG